MSKGPLEIEAIITVSDYWLAWKRAWRSVSDGDLFWCLCSWFFFVTQECGIGNICFLSYDTTVESDFYSLYLWLLKCKLLLSYCFVECVILLCWQWESSKARYCFPYDILKYEVWNLSSSFLINHLIWFATISRFTNHFTHLHLYSTI